jgi:Putative peptidoglycan binding domain
MITMKTLTSLLIGCSLVLAGAALAQEPVEHQSPSKNKSVPEKSHAPQPQPHPNAATHQGATQQHGTTQQHGAANQPGSTQQRGPTGGHAAGNEGSTGKGHKTPTHQQSGTAPDSNVSGQAAGGQTPTARQRVEQRRKGMQGQAEEKTTPNPTGSAAAAAGTGAASPNPQAGQQNAQRNQQNAQARMGGKGKKPDPQQVQQIKSQHANFRAQPKPQQVPPVTFNQTHRIEGSDRWQGQHYEVFRSYHPEWHDEGWYRSHYHRVELIGGGYYFFNNGYWFPAWGYSPSAQYYAYDGPIYAGHHAEPPDKVIADVQGVLQQMGYYTGEVDGLLGPLTREALTAYQGDQGLAQTAAIDEPTLDSLGMS